MKTSCAPKKPNSHMKRQEKIFLFSIKPKIENPKILST